MKFLNMIQVSLYFSNFTKVLFARRLNVQIFLINDVAFSSDMITDIMARYEQKTDFLDYDARMMTSLAENAFGDSPPIRGFYWCFRFEAKS